MEETHLTISGDFLKEYVKKQVPDVKLIVTDNGFYQIKAKEDILSGRWTTPELAWRQAYTFLTNQ